MIFQTHVSDRFAQQVEAIAKRLKTKPDYLMAIMWSESRLNPQARNPQAGATGLIQFMPETARYLGTSCEELYAMSAEEQLIFVERFFTPYASRCRSFSDWYLACFFPVAIGKPESYVLQTKRLSAALIARQNPLFDLNKDGQITVGEFCERLKTCYPREVRSALF